ncbi:hypothetical protein M0R04_11535 [Candidatus Dojkabacteria bacterium]|jgi:hypothetical protein|nr:hypothetical protein [Candidatus Dojkabacteria bacterium]
MVAPHTSIKEFDDIKGLDLHASELKRSHVNATYTKNAILRQTGALNKRPGWSRKASKVGGSGNDVGCFGAKVFHNVNTTTGVITEEILSVGDTVYKLTTGSFTLAYAGAAVATYSVITDGTDINFLIYLDDVLTYTYDMGNGSEVVPIYIVDLVAYLNGLTSFTAVGSGTCFAAFLPVIQAVTITAAPITITYNDWIALSTPTGYVNPITPAQTLPFYNYNATSTSTDFENASIVEVNDVIYFATGTDELHKYDGTRLYRAGMPHGDTPITVANAGAGVLDAGAYYYKITYSYTDAKENIVEGRISDSSVSLTVGANKKIDITYYNLRHSYTTPPINPENYKGYDTQSSNLKVNIWRTKHDQSATSTYYLVTAATNNSAADTTTYVDNIPDSSLGAAYIEPLKTPGLPPKCKYLDVWRNMLIMSGNPTAVNTVYYADIEGGNEIFPTANAFDVDSKVTGLRSLDNILGVFRLKAIDGVTGDLATDVFQVDHLSRDGVGCAANATIEEIGGKLYFLADRGVYRISQQGGLEHIGLAISPKLQAGNSFSFKQATAMNWHDKFLYAIHMPVCATNSSYSDNTTNEIFVFDYQREAWFAWDNFNFMGGYAQKDDGTLYILGRISTMKSIEILKKQLNMYDFSDHTDIINFDYRTAWDSMGEPSIFKKFLRIKVHSYDISINDFECDVFSVNLITQHDFIDQDITDLTLDFSGGNNGWGGTPWGVFTWGDIRSTQLRTKIASKKSKSMRTIFKNSNLHENVLISGWEVEVATPYTLTALAE